MVSFEIKTAINSKPEVRKFLNLKMVAIKVLEEEAGLEVKLNRYEYTRMFDYLEVINKKGGAKFFTMHFLQNGRVVQSSIISTDEKKGIFLFKRHKEF